MPAASTMADGRTLGQSTRLAGVGIQDVGGEEGKPGPGGRGFQRALQVELIRGRVGRAELEVVVADGQRGVAHRVVGVHHHAALGQVRLHARQGGGGGLERVAGVQEQQGPPIAGPRRAQVVDEAAEHAQAAARVRVRRDAAVQIVGADDGDGDAGGRAGRARPGQRGQPRERGPCRGEPRRVRRMAFSIRDRPEKWNWGRVSVD